MDIMSLYDKCAEMEPDMQLLAGVATDVPLDCLLGMYKYCRKNKDSDVAAVMGVLHDRLGYEFIKLEVALDGDSDK